MSIIEIKPQAITVQNRQAKSLTVSNKALTENGVVDDDGVSPAKRVGIKTLGCKVNTYESELISETLKSDHWQTVPSSDQADLYLINTCTVTKEADRQARQEVRKAVKRNPDALVVVTGCYAQMDPDACAAIPGVDLVLGNDQKLDVHSLLPQLQRGELPQIVVGDLDQHVSLPDKLITGFDSHTRAFVQIQQGCDQGCTFCIIHVARGPSRSIAPSVIKRQVQRLVLNGYPEVVICGVDLGSYGEDFPRTHEVFNLSSLLRELLALETKPDNPFRIRLSSLDPHHLTNELIELMASEPRICPQFHLSLQSGNTLILKRMKRRYDAAHVVERISRMRSKIPNLVISADVMVGFPTEQDEHFQDTLDLVRDLDIAYPHVFSYSQREGTPAARIPGAKQVPVEIKKQRNKAIRDLGDQLRADLMARSLGQTVWVLAEKPAKQAGLMLCRGEDYQEVLVSAEGLLQGQWIKVQLTHIEQGKLLGQQLDKVTVTS